MVGGTGLQRAPVQPRHQRPPPAGLGDQAVHPRARARGRRGPEQHLGVPAEGVPGAGFEGTRSSRSATTRTRTSAAASLWSATAASDNSVFAELGPEGRHQADRAPGAADGHPHQAVDQPGHDARWARGGRDAARDGLRVLHDRQPRVPRVRARSLPGELGPVGFSEVKGHGIDDEINKPEAAWRSSRARSADLEKEMLQAGGHQRHRQGRPGRRRGTSGARPARPRTTATPGSSAATTR